MSKRWGVTAILIALLVVLFAISWSLGARDADPDEEGFAGTDSVVVDIMDEQGAEPWFEPIWEPASGEIESGLFALQAALGAGVVGFAFGTFYGRNSERNRSEAATTVTDASSA